MEPSKKTKHSRRTPLKTLNTNTMLSNVHCQDESSSMSPLPRRSGTHGQMAVDWCDFDVTETLPSDWLSDYPKNCRKAKASTSSCSTTLETVFRFSKAILLNDTDESSLGSDSGFGNESLRLKSKSETAVFRDVQASAKNSSTLESQVSSRSGGNCLDVDDGFSEENAFLTKSNTTNLDFSSPFRNVKHLNFVRKDPSPFNLHRRRCSVTGNSDVMLNIRTSSKRLYSDENSESDDENNASTTPKRRKNVRCTALRRSLSGYPSTEMLLFQRSPSLSKSESTPTKFATEDTKACTIKTYAAMDVENSNLSRSHSEIPFAPSDRLDEKKVDRVIEASDNFSYMDSTNIIHHLLPTLDRQRFELSSVKAEDVANLLSNKNSGTNSLLLIDCRYPYEYNGGHVISAVNIHSEDHILNKLFYPALRRTKREESYCFGPKDTSITSPFLGDTIDSKSSLHSPLQCMKNHVNQSCVLIFYCEFSSRRAPNLAKFLRGIDRKFNLYNYPYLFYPDIFIMSGGYHNFVQKFNDLCEPAGYVKMFDKRFTSELGKYKRKTRKLRPQNPFLKRSPVSPLRLELDGIRPHSSPPSPPQAIIWS